MVRMVEISQATLTELEATSNKIRQSIIEMLTEAGSGHSAGSLDMADVFTALYFHVMRNDPKNPEWEDRDRLLLSAGHICPVRYAAMAHRGYFPIQELMTLRKFGSRLQGHPERIRLPSIETTSGPLGEGVAQGAGMAYAAKMDKKDWRVYVVTSDAEHQAGLHWEAAMFAGHYKLSNLINIIDRNFIQIDGDTEKIMTLEPLADKYRSFGWNVLECDGHDMRAIIGAYDIAKAVTDRPTVIIAHTIPGKGVGYMEGDYTWHGKPPSAKEADEALRELRASLQQIEAKA